MLDYNNRLLFVNPFLIDNYKDMASGELQEALKGRDAIAINQKAWQLDRNGKMKVMKKRHKWSEEEEIFLFVIYNYKKVADMAKGLGLTRSQVSGKIEHLKKQNLLAGLGYSKLRAEKEEKEKKRLLQLKNEREKRKKEQMTKEQQERERKAMAEKLKKQKEEERRINAMHKRQAAEAIKREKRNRDYGVGKKKLEVKFEKDKEYLFAIRDNGRRVRDVKGRLIQATNNHVTIETRNKVRESFLINDILINDVTVMEL